jgi:4-amino-4-deoxy-L-arabinose transferase-like glycosyltransferase
MTPWNVTLMPGIATLIFYALVQVYEGNNRWLFAAWTLSGLYFHIHFTAIFLPLIIIASLVFAPKKLQAVRYSLLSLPLFLVWLLPNIIYELQQTGGDRFQYQHFLKDYYIGFHLRFMLHRLNDALLQFQTILAYNVPLLTMLKFALPLLFAGVVVFFEKDTRMKKIGYLLSLWFIVPLIGFTLYGGPLSDYYFLFQVYPVLVILIYLQQKLLKLNFAVGLALLVIIWTAFVVHNTKDYWVKPETGGLAVQKAYVRQVIAAGHTIEYQEGSIESYLYGIWTERKHPAP